MKERESDIVFSICKYLAAQRHFFWRQNTAPTISKRENGWSFRRMPKHARTGVPDIIVVHTGRPYFLEVKRPGTYQSPAQKTLQEHTEKAGAIYSIVRSIQEAKALGF